MTGHQLSQAEADALIAMEKHRITMEGCGDKWAQPVPADIFPNLADPWLVLVRDFMRYCNITQPPKIERGLWT
ncbi:MAG: hypothetical protein FJ291_31015 [Planctomycetes bacterium]|nr:hypothetical protein [Planctomycetota bacterium]